MVDNEHLQAIKIFQIVVINYGDPKWPRGRTTNQMQRALCCRRMVKAPKLYTYRYITFLRSTGVTTRSVSTFTIDLHRCGRRAAHNYIAINCLYKLSKLS